MDIPMHAPLWTMRQFPCNMSPRVRSLGWSVLSLSHNYHTSSWMTLPMYTVTNSTGALREGPVFPQRSWKLMGPFLPPLLKFLQREVFPLFSWGEKWTWKLLLPSLPLIPRSGRWGWQVYEYKQSIYVRPSYSWAFSLWDLHSGDGYPELLPSMWSSYTSQCCPGSRVPTALLSWQWNSKKPNLSNLHLQV